ncbi:MAG TPA: MarR family transcriptional regulator [Gaiellaceae bacterium]|nr:MarR family transcriptional regulator [Gaiellaceae bacterium]
MSTQAPSRGLELDTWIRFLRAHATILRKLNADLLAEHGLTVNDFEVLLHLSRAPERSLRRVDLVERVLLTPSGITRLLDGLEHNGFVERAECATDRRVIYAKLTRAGLEKLARARRTHLAGVSSLFVERYSSDELTALSALLGRLPGTGGEEDACGE